MNDYDKERREWYLSHGICPHCGQNDLQRGYKLCLQCRMNDNERHKNKAISADVRQYRIDYKKRVSAERKAAGICTLWETKDGRKTYQLCYMPCKESGKTA